MNLISNLGSMGGLLAQYDKGGDFWFPAARSTYAGQVDYTYYFIYWTCVFFFVVIMAAMGYFCVRYRRRSKGEMPERSPSHNSLLETAWSVLPSILLVFMFYFGFVGYMDMRSMPDEAYPVDVTARKWVWTFAYEHGRVIESGTIAEDADWHDKDKLLENVATLRVPVNRDILLTMNSSDVLHSFYVPAFRTKQDVVPGRYTKIWFKATEPGTYDLFCAEYCGDKHSEMLGKIVVLTPEDFEKWIADARDLFKKFDNDYVKVGEYLYQTRGCTQCHSIDGTTKVNGGPSFLGSWGKDVALQDGSSVKMDENYIRESILNPQAKIHKGFGPIMPSFRGQLNDKDIDAIIAYIKNLNETQAQ